MLSVIVPTYNERENIPQLVERTLQAFDRLSEPAELLVVDDDSPDRTAQALQHLAGELGESQRVRVLVRTQEKGLAKAVTAGFDAAHGDVIAVMDADLSHPPETLPDMLAAIRSGADIAVASRYAPGGGTEGWPLRRRIISRAACWLARGVTHIRDATSGFFALRREALDTIEIKPRGYKIGLELFAQLQGSRVSEVPFVFTDRRYGSSKLSGAVMAAYLVQLAALYRARYPLSLGYVQFGLVGLLGMVVDGVVFGLVYHYLSLSGLGARDGGFLAQTLSFVAAAAFNFTLNKLWTFRDRSQGSKFQAFLAVSAVGFLLRSLVFEAVLTLPLATAAGSPWFGSEGLALASGIIAASLWNYFGSMHWAFRGEPRPVMQLAAPSALRATAQATAAYGAAALLLLFFAAKTPLAFDEAYYWQWSRHLAWGYYDHPPMIAFLIAAGTRLLGDNELGVRLVPLLLALAIPWMMQSLARRYWRSVDAGAWTLLAAVSIPLLAVGMTVATPDTPLVFFWASALLLVLRALERDRVSDWILVGIAVGLGLLCKYPMLLFYPAILAALLSLPRGRRVLLSPRPYGAALVSVVVAGPMLLWQFQHIEGGLLFQLRHGLGGMAGGAPQAPGVVGFANFVAGQLGMMTPVLFAFCVLALRRAVPQLAKGHLSLSGPIGRSSGGPLSSVEMLPFLIFPTLLPFFVFAAASFLAKSQPNWMAPAYVTAITLLGGELALQVASPDRRWARWVVWAGIGLAGSISLYVHIEAVTPLVAYRSGVLTQTWGHRQLADWVQRLENRHAESARPLRILASDYKLASILAFYLPDRPETCSPFEKGSGSAYYAWQQPSVGTEEAIYVTDRPADSFSRLFKETTPLGHHTVWRKGEAVRVLRAYIGKLRPGVCAPRPG